uniref:Putative glycosomal membrane protein n=1 Tax=Trypanosoma vivax (strain Y486) TaxID=1055687 RepID=G0UD60_TRYVY|nr:putative glycosomal membrane protein [Trypanosoma vivax Y486]
MNDFDRFVKLLSQTDGRDKIYKFLSGVAKALAYLDTAQPRVAAYKSIGSSLSDGRSLLRMVKWSGDVPKMQSIVTSFRSKGKVNLKDGIQLLRVLCNFLYVLGDNVAYFARYKLVNLQHKRVYLNAKTAQFWGFLFAAVLDIIALRAALKKRSSDAVASKKEAKNALINLAKDGSDVLVTMAVVGYMKEVWRPNALTSGVLTAVSGGVATYLNWTKIK